MFSTDGMFLTSIIVSVVLDLDFVVEKGGDPVLCLVRNESVDEPFLPERVNFFSFSG